MNGTQNIPSCLVMKKPQWSTIVLKTLGIQCQELFVPDAVKCAQYLYYSNDREGSTPNYMLVSMSVGKWEHISEQSVCNVT